MKKCIFCAKIILKKYIIGGKMEERMYFKIAKEFVDTFNGKSDFLQKN